MDPYLAVPEFPDASATDLLRERIGGLADELYDLLREMGDRDLDYRDARDAEAIMARLEHDRARLAWVCGVSSVNPERRAA